MLTGTKLKDNPNLQAGFYATRRSVGHSVAFCMSVRDGVSHEEHICNAVQLRMNIALHNSVVA